jgi:hypothetical protein
MGEIAIVIVALIIAAGVPYTSASILVWLFTRQERTKTND